MKRVFSSPDSVLVGLRQSVLEAANIQCVIANRYSHLDFTRADSSNGLDPLELCVVRDEDYEDAMRLLDVADSPKL